MDDRSIDFRLLECLKVLVAEGHVTRAAERLGMSQPKLSSALARLRRLTGDPLLLRTPKGMQPTPLARGLAGHADEFLTRWRNSVNDEMGFDPKNDARTFRIWANDFVSQTLLLPLLEHVRHEAPNVNISVTQPLSTLRNALETGEVDLLVGNLPDPPQDLYMSLLTSWEMVCLVASDHPRIDDSMSLAEYAAEPHLVLSLERDHLHQLSERFIDSFLAERNMHRRIAVTAASMLVAPQIVAATDLVSVFNKPLALSASAQLPVKIIELPFTMPKTDLAIFWHARTKNDPANRWLRSAIRDALRACLLIEGGLT